MSERPTAEEFSAIARHFNRLDGRIGISERQLRRLCRRFGYATPRRDGRWPVKESVV